MKTLLYVSDLADEAPPSVVAAITKRARANNRQYGIQGLLIFDGARFAQMLEGPAPAIDELLEKIGADQRHVNMRVLSLREHPDADRFAGWELGFLWIEDDEREGIARLWQPMDGAAAEAMFLQLASSADHNGAPPLAVPPQTVEDGSCRHGQHRTDVTDSQ